MFDFLYVWLEKLRGYILHRFRQQLLLEYSEGPKLTFSSLYDPTVPPENGWSSDDSGLEEIYEL